MQNNNCIAIIPARGGSKRIKRKNIKNFFGYPIISYAIKNAISSKLFKDVIISTDDNEIANKALKYGAKVPFIRPKKISGDDVGILEVMSHSVSALLSNYHNLSAVCCIFPATPLLNKSDLTKSFKIFKTRKWEYVFGAIKFNHPPLRGFALNKRKGLDMFSKNSVNKNEKTQNFKTIYHDAGQFYWANPKTWIKKKKVFSNKSTVYINPNSNFVDIDTLEDWKRAEMIYSYTKKK